MSNILPTSLKRGFTLIELLIVVAVLGVLAGGAIALLNPTSQIQKSQDARRKADLAEIQRALEVFYQDNGKYPQASEFKIVDLGTGSPISWGDSWTPYMGNLPKDPKSGRNYVYNVTDANRQSYCLYASLERESPITPGSCLGGGSCGTACNYGVSSPNISP